MSRTFKKLGVGLVAVLALSLIVTSVAGAATFTSSSYPASFEAEAEMGDGYAITEAGKVECSGWAGATLNEASSTITISKGETSECKAFGFVSSTVTGGGCSVLVHVKEGSGHAYTGTSDLQCPEGKSVTVVGGACEMKVFPQEGAVVLEYIENTEEGSVEVSVKSSNVAYTVTKDGFLCPFNGTGNKTGATFVHSEPLVVKPVGITVGIE
jgi:hypothetical protein